MPTTPTSRACGDSSSGPIRTGPTTTSGPRCEPPTVSTSCARDVVATADGVVHVAFDLPMPGASFVELTPLD
ncbi:MAG TPA: hypothetical protein VEX15_18445 [Nocardioidaceae bacterium]|nr:hypothetical protein [Nocardioidaceae bacterium]